MDLCFLRVNMSENGDSQHWPQRESRGIVRGVIFWSMPSFEV